MLFKLKQKHSQEKSVKCNLDVFHNSLYILINAIHIYSTYIRFNLFRVQTADCQPESSWAEFGSEVAVKKFAKGHFYDKVKDKEMARSKCFTKAEVEEECEKLCRKAFSKECEMLARLVHRHNTCFIFTHYF